MDLPTLDEFISSESSRDRSYVDHPDFDSLYMRKGARYLTDVMGVSKYYENVLDIANISARQPGKGDFKKLIKYLGEKWDGVIYVESVLAEEFGSALLRMGFQPINPNHDYGGLPRNFVLNLHKGKESRIKVRI